MKKRILSIFLTLVLVLSFSLVTAVPAGAADPITIPSSTMVFQSDSEHPLTDQGGGIYSGTIPCVNGAGEVTAGVLGGEDGFDNYAKDGATAQFIDERNLVGPPWIRIIAGHDAYPTWDPDVPDWNYYALTLEGNSWQLVYNQNNPRDWEVCGGVPISGIMDWDTMYASETNLGHCFGDPEDVGPVKPEYIDWAAAHGGGAACWDMDWVWGCDVVPLAFPGFDVEVAGEGPYTVTMTPAKAPAGVTPPGPVVNEDTGESFGTIQSAIDLATADGTVNVAEGIYDEQVVITQSLTLIGAGAATTTIQAPNPLTGDLSIVTISGDVDVEFSGFTVKGPGPGTSNSIFAGIFVRDTANANIHDNEILDIQDDPICGSQKPHAIWVGCFMYEPGTTGTATIKDNIITGYQKGGITVEGSGSTATIEGNTITGQGPFQPLAQDGIRVAFNAGPVSIKGNTISANKHDGPGTCVPPDDDSGCGNCWGGAGIFLMAGYHDIDIEGNTITANRVGILLDGDLGNVPTPGDKVNITNNDIIGNLGEGIHIQYIGWGVGPAPTNVHIVGNNIQTSYDTPESECPWFKTQAWGIMVDFLCESDTNYAHFNNIVGTPYIGLWNGKWSEPGDTVHVFDATMNWWGDISGPTFEGTAGEEYIGGTGDKVSDNVEYTPWLTRKSEIVLADNIAYIGIPMVHLDTGWNTFSTPIALDPGEKTIDGVVTYPAANTWGDYVALGDRLNIHDTSPAYAFDPTATPPWVPLTDNYQLKPCDAIYVRMAGPDVAAILFSPKHSVPTKEVSQGWNLIGLAGFGQEEEGMPVDAALESLYMVPGDFTGYSQVVSPPLNQEPWVFVRDQSSWWGHRLPLMRPTQGYWVFMENGPDTLAGFTFTPMSLAMLGGER